MADAPGPAGWWLQRIDERFDRISRCVSAIRNIEE